MGIFLNFTICPERIPDHRWEEVYEEALRMVEPCDLLDCIARPEAPLFIQRRCAGILGTRL